MLHVRINIFSMKCCCIIYFEHRNDVRSMVKICIETTSRDSMQLLTTTTDFVTLFCFTGLFIFIQALLFVGVESERPVSAQF